MELINQLKENNHTFTSKIRDSPFIEGNVTMGEVVESYKDICECFIANNEIEYSTHSSKETFTKTKKLEIASDIDNSSFTKTFSKNMIQRGLQKENHYSSVLYLNHHYKVNCVIYNSVTNKYYKTSVREAPSLVCMFGNNNQWTIMEGEIPQDIDYSSIDDLEHIVTMDISTNMIYKTDLLAIGKYKVAELEEKAKELDIPMTINGKKKNKKTLYGDINLKLCQQLI